MRKIKKKNKSKWKVPARQRSCLECTEKFICEASVYSILEPQETDVYDRKDLCSQCWEKIEGSKEDFIHWKTVIPSKEKQQPVPPSEKALNFLKEALEKEDEKVKQLAFFLSQLMVRRKQLIPLRKSLQQREGVLLFENPKTEEIIPVETMPSLPEQSFDQIFQEIKQVLEEDTQEEGA
jgi:hypothetical protein